MIGFLTYLLKVSISLAVIFLFYQLVLRKLTFHNWNRFYLLGYSFLSILIPFIDISLVVKKENWENAVLVQWVPLVNGAEGNAFVQNDPVSSFSPWSLLTILLLSGTLLLLARFFIQWHSFRNLLRRAELIEDGKMKIYKVDENIIPFSFGRSVFINPALHSESEIREIILHEFVHARQRHTVDIIWAELICLLNWYNPFAWMIRKAIRQNLEFIADQKVLEQGIDRKQYQYLLLKVIGNEQFSIASKFNFSSLKKRIAMMNKMKSTGVHVLKFLFILPLLAVLLLAFRNKINPGMASLSQPFCDTVKPPTAPLPPLDPASPASPSTLVTPLPPEAPLPPFAIRPLSCDPAKKGTPVAVGTNSITGSSKVKVFEITKEMATMELKDGSTEVYNLNNNAEKKKFEEKYGGIYQTGSAAPVAFASGTNAVTAITLPPGQATGANLIDTRGNIITGAEDIIITIKNTTTMEELDKFVEDVKSKGMVLKFDNVDFNDGKIVSISGMMKKGTSTSNFSMTDFKQFTLAAMEKDGKVWLKVSTDDRRVI
jgi:hypothetical protein